MSTISKKLLGLAAAVLCGTYCASPLFAGTWATTTAPGNVGLALLLSDGSVLAQKGPGFSNWFRLYPDSSGHYTTSSQWTANVAAMPDNRQFFSSDVLQSGQVFVAGGEYGATGSGNRAAIYDPVNDVWTPITVPAGVLASGFTASDGLNAGFRDSPSVVLPDGSVLIVPIFPATNNVAAIYHPGANTWTETAPSLNNLNEAGLNKLPDGSILVIDKQLTSTERYIPSTGQWIADASTPVSFYSTNAEIGASLQIPDGRVLFFGGTGYTLYYTPSGNQTHGSWALGPNIPAGLVARDAPAALLPNGNVLCAFTPTTNDVPISFYEYNPVTQVFTPQLAPGGTSTYTRAISDQTAMLVLPDGNVLFTDTGSSTAYIYQPSTTTPQQAWKPAIQGYSMNPNYSFHFFGTQFNGLSQGATFGDDNQMDSDYPLVRFTDSGGNVFFGRTDNWSSTGLQTGSQVVSTECVIPGNVFNNAGTFTVQVVANGIASDPISFAAPIWVQFGFGGVQLGTQVNPYGTLAQAVNAVAPGESILIKPGLSHETMTISKAMTINTWNGTATIGQ